MTCQADGLSSGGANPTCLVVDVSRVVRKVTRWIFENHGFAVQRSTNGVEALEMGCKAQPRSALLDWNMLLMGGFNFLSMVRAEFSAVGPIILIRTIANDVHLVAQAMRACAQGYTTKAFDAPTLLRKLASFCLP